MLIGVTMDQDHCRRLSGLRHAPGRGLGSGAAERAADHGSCGDPFTPLGGKAVYQHAAVRHAGEVDALRVDSGFAGNRLDHFVDKGHVVDSVVGGLAAAMPGVPVLQVAEQPDPLGVGDEEGILIRKVAESGFIGGLSGRAEGTVQHYHQRQRQRSAPDITFGDV